MGPPVAGVQLVEREGVLASLRALASTAFARRGALSFVTGEAGIGKTAVVTELAT